MVNKAIAKVAQSSQSAMRERKGVDLESSLKSSDVDHGGLAFVYPYGATLSVELPGIPVLSTGHIAYPLNRPVVAFSSPEGCKGRIAVVGSVRIFDDEWLTKEENGKLLVMFQEEFGLKIPFFPLNSFLNDAREWTEAHFFVGCDSEVAFARGDL